ncbi:MAG TPA: RNase adapter RapZ [Thermoanaerobacterales bacterium]|nr:RNase adapter RapZ [Thermoanaerobacterales bacterium]
MKFVIITGLSGAGKTQAMRCFEDMGYFCVDNLPSTLIPKFVELCSKGTGAIDKVALVIDIRGRGFFDTLFVSLKTLIDKGFSYKILFLEASDEVLIKRFKESRRHHPLAPEGRLIDGIKEERKRMHDLKTKAEYIIDTTNLTPGQLKEELKNKFILGREKRIVITILSFGSKYGIPLDVDLLFDVRFLPNPYYVEELKKLTGTDLEVFNYVINNPISKIFIEKLKDLLDFLIPYYIKEGKPQLVIGIGCTGGQHRSVAIAEKLKMFFEKNHSVTTNHRDIHKDNTGDDF